MTTGQRTPTSTWIHWTGKNEGIKKNLQLDRLAAARVFDPEVAVSLNWFLATGLVFNILKKKHLWMNQSVSLLKMTIHIL